MTKNQITVYLTDTELQVIDNIAGRIELTRSATIRRMLNDFLRVLQDGNILDADMNFNVIQTASDEV